MEHESNFSNELSGKIALISGGTKNAGKAIATGLHASGATVVTTARNKPEHDDQDIHFIPADLSQPGGAGTVVLGILGKFGGLDLLINNLGGSETPGGGFAVLTNEDREPSIRTNLLDPEILDKGFLPQMLERGNGVIIHVASIQGRLPLLDSTLPYAAAKQA